MLACRQRLMSLGRGWRRFKCRDRVISYSDDEGGAAGPKLCRHQLSRLIHLLRPRCASGAFEWKLASRCEAPLLRVASRSFRIPAAFRIEVAARSARLLLEVVVGRRHVGTAPPSVAVGLDGATSYILLTLTLQQYRYRTRVPGNGTGTWNRY